MRSREYIEHLFKNGKHFCIMPWVHLYVTTLGIMSPCSIQRGGPVADKGYGDLNEHSFHELWQGEAIRNFRLIKLADEKDERCSICHEIEKATGQSVRTIFNPIFLPVIDWVINTDDSGYSPQAAPIYWDIRFSNLCNLRCRNCGADCSSAWYNDERALSGQNFSDNSVNAIKGLKDPGALLSDLEPYFPYTGFYYFAGGEPLLYSENLTILEKLDEMKNYNVRLSYNTNFTQFNKNNKFLELWKKFKDLTIMLSLDGNHKRGEYLRKGSNWGGIITNLNTLKKECPQAEIIVRFTVNAFNILHLPDFHKEMTEHLRVDKIDFNMVVEPDYYSVRILPREMKERAAEKIEDHLKWAIRQDPFNVGGNADFNHFADKWRNCIKYMNSEDLTHLIPKFLEKTKKLDDLRNENCLAVFPELEPLFR